MISQMTDRFLTLWHMNALTCTLFHNWKAIIVDQISGSRVRVHAVCRSSSSSGQEVIFCPKDLLIALESYANDRPVRSSAHDHLVMRRWWSIYILTILTTGKRIITIIFMTSGIWTRRGFSCFKKDDDRLSVKHDILTSFLARIFTALFFFSCAGSIITAKAMI